MNSELYTDLTPELISKLDSYIDNNKPKKYVSSLSNYQLPTSINNLHIIQNLKIIIYYKTGNHNYKYMNHGQMPIANLLKSLLYNKFV